MNQLPDYVTDDFVRAYARFLGVPVGECWYMIERFGPPEPLDAVLVGRDEIAASWRQILIEAEEGGT